MISRYSLWCHLEMEERTHCILVFLLSLRPLQTLESGFHIIALIAG